MNIIFNNIPFDFYPPLIASICANTVYAMLISKVAQDFMKTIYDNKVLNKTMIKFLHVLPDSVIIHSKAKKSHEEIGMFALINIYLINCLKLFYLSYFLIEDSINIFRDKYNIFK